MFTVIFLGRIFRNHICKYLLQFHYYLNIFYLPSNLNPRFCAELMNTHFPRNYQFQECYENTEKMSQENRKKFQTAWKDFTERSLTAHTGSSGMNSFYFQMSEDLEILQKQNGNKETLRFLFYLCKLLFSKNCQLYISLFSVEISITWCFNCGISFASELDEYVLKALLQDLSIFKHSYIHFSNF